MWLSSAVLRENKKVSYRKQTVRLLHLYYKRRTGVGKIRDRSKLAVDVRDDKRLGWTTEAHTRVRLISLSGTR